MKKGKFEYKEFKEFSKKIQQMSEQEIINQFIESSAKELAARLLTRVKKRTPVGQYPSGSGKVGGTLRRGWTIGEIRHEGRDCIIEVINPLEYASYVEYGHRQEPGRYVPAIGKKLKKAWVSGKFMLTISEQELEQITPAILERKLIKFLQNNLK